MSIFKGLTLTALIVASSVTFVAPSQATAENTTAPTTVEAVQPVTADPNAVVTYETSTVTTTSGTIDPINTTPEGTPIYNLVGIAVPETTTPTTTAPETTAPAPVEAVAPATTAPATETTADTAPATQDQLQAGDAWAGSGTYYAQVCPTDWYQFAGTECVDPSSPTTPLVPVGTTADGTPVYDLTGIATTEADTYPAPAPNIPTPTATAPTAPSADLPTAGAICYEDEPCWNCAYMGNRICGLNEAFALSGYTDHTVFDHRYFGLTKTSGIPARFGFRNVVSVINPEYTYVFTTTPEEDCANPATDKGWKDQWCTAKK